MKVGILGLRGYPFPDAYGKIVAQVGPRLVARGHQVTIFVRTKWARSGESFRDGMRIVAVPHVPTKSLDTLTYGAAATLVTMVSELDVLHFHGTALAPFSFLPRLCGKKTIVHVHALDWQRDKFSWLGRRVLRAFERLATVLPNRTAVISQTLRDQLKAAHGVVCDHIPQGVTIPSERSIEPVFDHGIKGEPFVLYVGRLVPEKACEVLIRAFHRSGFQGKLVLAGEGSFTPNYVQKLREMAGPDVIFTGSLGERELEILYSGAWAYVQPSRVEGLSMALLEAMSYGIATVVSDIPANLEAVGGAALVFPEGDDKRLAERLKTLFHDETTRKDTGARCRAHVAATFSWDSVVDATELLYLQASRCGGSGSEMEASLGSSVDLHSSPDRATGVGVGGSLGPSPDGASGLLLRSAGDGRGKAVLHVEAPDDDPRCGEELGIVAAPERGADGAVGSNLG